MRRRYVCFILMMLVATGARADYVVVCPVSEMVDDGLTVLVERAVKEAEGARALVLEVDTPGGLVDSAIEISKSLMSSKARTIAYIKGMGAISAGALISYSCKDIIMAPDTNIGAATPVVPSAEGMMPTGEKEVSFMRAKMRALAETNGHNPAIAEAMVDPDVELHAYVDVAGKTQVYGIYPTSVSGTSPADQMVKKALEALPPELEAVKKIAEEKLTAPPQATPPPAAEAAPPAPGALPQGEVILPAGKLLTLTPQEALKYGLIRSTAGSIEEALAFYGITDVEIRRIEPTWAEAIFRWLTNPMVAGILLMLGIGGIYLEIKTPGFGIAGVVGIVCLALFFGAHVVLGVAEWVDVLLVISGIGLILLEIFVLPGFGLAGVTGIILVLAGLYLSLTTVPIPRYSWDYDRLRGAMVSLTVAATTLTIFVYVMWKLFPHTPFHSMLVQTHAEAPEQGYVVQTADQNSVVGLTGVATSMLRPAGRGRFEGKTYQVVTRGDFIEPGSPIRIVQVDGNRYVVEKAEEA